MPVIDETIAEVDLDGGPMPLPFAAHDPRAITVGSSSKSHWGGLRTGWVRAPRTALDGLVESRVTSDLGAPVLEQLVLLELMRVAPGLTPRRRDDLCASRDALVAALGATCPSCASGCPAAGCSCGASCPRASTRAGVAVAAEDEGLLVAAGPRFAVVGGLERWVRLPYVLAPEVMTEAVERLARAVETVRSGSVGSTGARARGDRRAARPLVA